jgi:Bacterial regulatory helix-turn-helix protein, lysR family
VRGNRLSPSNKSTSARERPLWGSGEFFLRDLSPAMSLLGLGRVKMFCRKGLGRQMDRIDAMKVFVTAVDEGSLAGAARRLKRSPTAVSRALTFLEARLGVEYCTEPPVL